MTETAHKNWTCSVNIAWIKSVAQHLDLFFMHDQIELGNQIPYILGLSSIFYLYCQCCFSYRCAELLHYLLSLWKCIMCPAAWPIWAIITECCLFIRNLPNLLLCFQFIQNWHNHQIAFSHKVLLKHLFNTRWLFLPFQWPDILSMKYELLTDRNKLICNATESSSCLCLFSISIISRWYDTFNVFWEGRGWHVVSILKWYEGKEITHKESMQFYQTLEQVSYYLHCAKPSSFCIWI